MSVIHPMIVPRVSVCFDSKNGGHPKHFIHGTFHFPFFLRNKEMAGTTMAASPEDDDSFQVHTSSSGTKPKQVYIGGLPKNLPNLKQDLIDWMQEQIPNLPIETISINVGGKHPHALVDCGTQANLVISKLHQQTFKGRRLTVQREKRSNKKQNIGNSSNDKAKKKKPQKRQFGGWSKPKKEFTQIPMDEAAANIRAVVEEEVKASEEGGEDPINVALASTAAASFLAAMNGFSEPQHDFLDPKAEEEVSSEIPVDNGFQLKGMSELLADFGAEDPNWQKQSVLIEETNVEETASRLAPKGKAPIHIILVSFGFLHGAPKRQEGWSHSQPLAIMDCRELFESVPKHLEWKTGLTGLIKRIIRQVNRDNDIQQYARTTIANQVWDCLLEAQGDGFGYASPLEVTVYVGSETGKHRSVVLCEWAAIALRKKLRKNEKNCVHQPVSVATCHRDVDRNKKFPHNGKPQKKTHDFGADW